MYLYNIIDHDNAEPVPALLAWPEVTGSWTCILPLPISVRQAPGWLRNQQSYLENGGVVYELYLGCSDHQKTDQNSSQDFHLLWYIFLDQCNSQTNLAFTHRSTRWLFGTFQACFHSLYYRIMFNITHLQQVRLNYGK